MKERTLKILYPIGVVTTIAVIFITIRLTAQDPPKDSVQDTTLKTVVVDTIPDNSILNDSTYIKELSNRKKEKYLEWKKDEDVVMRQQQMHENLNEMDRLKMVNDSILKEMKKR